MTRWIVGRLAYDGKPSHLHLALEAPIADSAGAYFVRRREDGSPGGCVGNERFHVKRGRLVEVGPGRHAYGSFGRSVAREVTDPDLVRQIDEARATVEEARKLLHAALRAEQEALEGAAARSPVARFGR